MTGINKQFIPFLTKLLSLPRKIPGVNGINATSIAQETKARGHWNVLKSKMLISTSIQ